MALNTENNIQKWLDGQVSLGAAASWEKNEIRIISEIAYTLALQGRTREAIVLFEGLLAIAPATAYFQAALGALFLRSGNFAKAIEHLDAALKIEPADIISLVNRGEAFLRAGNSANSRRDLERALELNAPSSSERFDVNDEVAMIIKRARGLLQTQKL